MISKNKDVDRDKILGAKVTIKVLLQNDSVRYFNGFVTRFSAGDSLGRYSRYHAVVRPWLWFLTRTADCRIFQDKRSRQIVEEVFADHPGVADFVFELTEDYRTWNYCVQYRETDFNFVSRLLEHEGIYYYYRHTDGHHTLVLTDSIDKHEAIPGYETLQFIRRGAGQGRASSTSARGSFARGATGRLRARRLRLRAAERRSDHDENVAARLHAQRTYEVYDYPGVLRPEAAWRTLRACAHRRVRRTVRDGAGGDELSWRERRLTLHARGRTRDKVNGEYLVIGATQPLETSQYESAAATGGAEFRCSFTALSCGQQFRPRRMTPKPCVQGPQTAVVVGPAGDEIYTDKYGRVKVQFHWDRGARRTRTARAGCACRTRGRARAGARCATPRIGQEVIVDFLEGDPDQPIITGRVYNEEQQPPFGFPAGAVISGIKSQTHKGAGYNELSMDDTAGKEKITIHGQYDMNTTVEHDQTNTVKNDMTNTVWASTPRRSPRTHRSQSRPASLNTR